jgi:hypothetical protein
MLVGRLRWVPPTAALVQRRKTKRLYFGPARPLVFATGGVYDDAPIKTNLISSV